MYLWSFDDFKPGEGGLNDREAGDLQDSGQMRHESVASYGPRATSGAISFVKKSAGHFRALWSYSKDCLSLIFMQ